MMTSICFGNLLFKLRDTIRDTLWYALMILSVRAENFHLNVGFTEFKHSGTFFHNA